ncbi:putative membrane protein [Methanococcus voltae]|uniref:hypothetical protein n=1 Tax=Methanococcus voltae TaxID=2188 RepID=UPI001AEB991E|nr:hypothetical protein [Methanococcus voltae]MBP2143881.1 putative membrane protein [Methanococcus voltae]
MSKKFKSWMDKYIHSKLFLSHLVLYTLLFGIGFYFLLNADYVNQLIGKTMIFSLIFSNAFSIITIYLTAIVISIALRPKIDVNNLGMKYLFKNIMKIL